MVFKKAMPADKDILLKAYRLMSTARAMAETYDANRSVCKYVHSTSRGHEAIDRKSTRLNSSHRT